jgi:ABC-type transport system involved in cytochrome bd biosynthesis fused ATPase/permease subunit
MVEKKDIMKNDLMKIIGIGFILSLIASFGAGALVVFILGFNIFGLGLGIFAMLFLSGILFAIMMSITILIAIIFFAIRDTGKDFQQTKNTNYSFKQQQEVGKNTQKLNQPVIKKKDEGN